MRTEIEVLERIKQVEKDNEHLLNQKGAHIQINAPVALLQTNLRGTLNALYWIIGKERPKYKCDEFPK